MNQSNTIVKQTVNKDFDLRRSPEATTGAPGRKVGEQMRVEITPDRIRVRAYEIYKARNGRPGDPMSDWRQAEEELNGGSSSKVAAVGGREASQSSDEQRARTKQAHA